MIIRTISIKVFRAGNRESYTHRTRAEKHQQFTATGIEQILAEYAEKIELIAPDQYRMVQVGPGEFNFVHTG